MSGQTEDRSGCIPHGPDELCDYCGPAWDAFVAGFSRRRDECPDREDAARYRFIRSLAAQDDQFAFDVVEEAAWATHSGCAHNFDLNIDAAMAAQRYTLTDAGRALLEGKS